MVLVFVFESFSLLVAPASGCCSVKTSDGLGRSLGGLGAVLKMLERSAAKMLFLHGF